MMLTKYLVLIGRTFIATFFIVNFFNIIPINFNNNAWYTQVSMLLVDTASILLLGLISLKICSIIITKNNQKDISNNVTEKSKLIIEREEKTINNINNFSKYLMISFLLLAFFQFYIFFNGTTQINKEYLNRYQNIERKFKESVNNLELNLADNNSSEDIKNDIKILEIKKNQYISSNDKFISKTRFLLVRGNMKVFIMSLIWAYGLYKLSGIKY